MNDVKNFFPIQLADYAVIHNLQDEQGLYWWIKHTLNILPFGMMQSKRK
jgi:hypothetical protein